MKFKKYIIFILVAAFLCFAPVTTASAEETDTRTMALINKPGVVFLYTTWYADVVIPGLAFDDAIWTDMDYYVQSMIDSGEMSPDDPNNFVTAYMNLLTDYLPAYTYDSGTPYSQTASASFCGTGFIVTPDGYIVTNAHVVTTDEEAMKYQFASDVLNEIVTTDVQSLVDNMIYTFGVSPTEEQIQAFAEMYYLLYMQNMTVDNLQHDFQCYMGNVQPGADVSAKALAMDLRKVGESIPGKDVAILKIDKTNLPTVTLGDDGAIKTGDQVYAMGYPADATVTDVLNIDQALQEPTLTSGIISAKKEMAGGWSILQTDADIHGGNSGGPLFNTAGEVVGINTFGMIDQETGVASSGMNFAVPISIAKQFLNEINIQPSESDFTKQYKQAISMYNSGDYKGALEILRTINEINPGYPVIADLLSECSSKASSQTASSAAEPSEQPSGVKAGDKPVSGEGTQSESPFNMMLLIIIIVAAAAVVVVVLMLTRRKNGHSKPVTQAAAAAPAPVERPAPATPVAPVEKPTEPAAAAKCPACGAPVDPHAKFCPECGATIQAHCKNCGAKLEAGAKFCPECGAKTHEE